MPRRYSTLIALFLGGAALASGFRTGTARAQELPEALALPGSPALSDSVAPDPLLFYLEGNNRAFGGESRAAIRLYRQALAADTSQVGIRLALSRAYSGSEQPDSALFWANEARKRDPRSTEALQLAGMSALRLGRNEEAIDALRAAVALDPTDSGSFMNLLYLLESSKRYDEALAMIDAAPDDLRESPGFRVRRGRLFVQTGNAARAVPDLANLLRAEPGFPEAEMILALALSKGAESPPDTSQVESLLRDRPLLDRTRAALARYYLGAGDYESARRHLEVLSAHDPEDPRVLRDLGVLLFRRGDLEAAEERFRTLHRLPPDDPDSLRWLCRLAVMREHPDEALMIAGSLQARNPGDPDALICQATALMLLRKPEEALRAADAVLAADSTHREAGVLAATILDDMGRPADGVTRLRAVVASHPGDRGVLFAYGATLERADQVDSSLAVFDRLIRAYPDDDEILNHAGYICIDRGVRVPEGLAWVQRALDRQPDNGAYLDSYGWGLFRTGRLGDSLGWLRRAAEKSPREAEIRLHLGAVLEALGRPGEAGAAYDEALRLRPGDPGIQRRRAGVGAGGGAQPPAEQPTPKSPASK